MTTRRSLLARLDAIEAALTPPQVEWTVVWDDDPEAPADAHTIRLRWPEDLQGGDLRASSPLGIPKAG